MILHDQLIIVVSKINLSLGSISTPKEWLRKLMPWEEQCMAIEFMIEPSCSLRKLATCVDVFVTSECIHLCYLCIVTRCLFRDVSIMYLSHVVMPRFFDREDQ